MLFIVAGLVVALAVSLAPQWLYVAASLRYSDASDGQRSDSTTDVPVGTSVALDGDAPPLTGPAPLWLYGRRTRTSVGAAPQQPADGSGRLMVPSEQSLRSRWN